MSKTGSPGEKSKANWVTKHNESQLLLLAVFSACGGMRTGSSMPFLAAYFPVLAYGTPGKGGPFMAPPREDALMG